MGCGAADCPVAGIRNLPGLRRVIEMSSYGVYTAGTNASAAQVAGISSTPWSARSTARRSASHDGWTRQTREKSRPFQAQSLRITVRGPQEAIGRLAGQSMVSSRPPAKANP
jgi:hypothetical protein